ncbi:MAG TPA: TRAP transporter small permease, partial [Shewanella sp.]|nr:TRAP transporter small permease [Shewanella sp.]
LTWRFVELFIAILRDQVSGFQFADEAKESMHLIDESAKNAKVDPVSDQKEAK